MNLSAMNTTVVNCGADAAPAASVAKTCSESGWPFTDRSAVCLIRLETDRNGFPFYARVEPAGEGGIRAWVDLTAPALALDDIAGIDVPTDAPLQSPACQKAAAAMLAEISRRIRLVKGIWCEGPRGMTVGFEVLLPADAGGEQLSEAISALSVACQFAGPEIQLLMSDSDVAELYIAQHCRAGMFPGRLDLPGTRASGSLVPEV